MGLLLQKYVLCWVHCIPEAENIFEDKAKRAEYAKYWLNEVMKTAKEAGMIITLSVEITYDDENAMVKMLNKVLKTYPLIDTFEIISVELNEDATEVTVNTKITPENSNEGIKYLSLNYKKVDGKWNF